MYVKILSVERERERTRFIFAIWIRIRISEKLDPESDPNYSVKSKFKSFGGSKQSRWGP